VSPVVYFDLSNEQAVDFGTPTKLRQEYDEQLLISSLEGLVNRNGRQLFVRYLPAGDDFWWARLTDKGSWLDGATVQTVSSLQALLTQFASSYQGAVVYDPSVPSTSNVAATVAGADNLLVLRYDANPASLYQQLTTGPSAIPVKVWLINQNGTPLFTGSGTIPGTTLPSTGSAKNDAYRWLIQNYLKAGKLDPTQLGYYCDSFWLQVNPGVGFGDNLPNLDYLVAHRGLIFDLDVFGDQAPVDDPAQPVGTDLATLTLILSTCNQLTGNQAFINLHGFVPWAYKYTTSVIGSWNAGGSHDPVPAEWTMVQLLTSYNVASDPDAMVDMPNASFYQHYPLPAVIPQAAPRLSKQALIQQGILAADGSLLPVNYYAFYVGDYDSAAWLYNFTPSFWTDTARGSVPLSWAFNPNLADRFPFGMHWLRSTATTNDSFIAGDDGAGYINPALLTEPRTSGLPDGLPLWRARNVGYFNQWDLDTVGFVIDGYSPFMAPEALDGYAVFSPGGLVCQYTPPVPVDNGLPLLQIASIGISSGSDMVSLFSANGPHFVAARTILWSPTQYVNAVLQIDTTSSLPHKLVDMRTLLQLYKYAQTGVFDAVAPQTYDQWASRYFPNAPNLIPDGSFDYTAVGTSLGSPPDTVDSTTFANFRFFNIISNTVSFKASVVAGGTTGSLCLKMDVTNGTNGNAPVAFGAYGFDQLPANYIPTSFGTTYQLSFDAENVLAGTAPLGVDIAEYDIAGNYLGQQTTQVYTLLPPLGGSAVGAAQGFSHYTFPFTPVNPTVSDVDIVFGLGTSLAGTFKAEIDNIQYGTVTTSAPSVIPQNDGVPNLLKYAFDINPLGTMSATDFAALPVGSLDTTTTPGTTFLALTYRQSAAATGIVIHVQTSPDLKTWTTVTPDITKTLGADPITGDPMIKVEVNTKGATSEFIRLQVTKP
jgi:GxGYxYP putative glycoside hydrolase C-terminal domain/GxGYxY sequence motif in domain of unknown function N-terminal